MGVISRRSIQEPELEIYSRVRNRPYLNIGARQTGGSSLFGGKIGC